MNRIRRIGDWMASDQGMRVAFGLIVFNLSLYTASKLWTLLS